MGTPLGGSGGHFLLLAQGEYDFSKTLGIVAGVNLGLAAPFPSASASAAATGSRTSACRSHRGAKPSSRSVASST